VFKSLQQRKERVQNIGTIIGREAR